MGYYITLNSGVKIYVEDLNPEGKKTIIFLHGWPGSHELFEYQFDCFVKEGYRCIAPDTRGFGKSDKPYSGYDYNTLSDDLRCVVDSLGVEKFTLLGHSTGGAVAVRYMTRHKGYGVEKLILCAAAAPSLIKRPYFNFGLKKEVVENIICETYKDRPKMLENFSHMFFHRKVSKPFLQWFFNLGLEAASWSTAEIARTWLHEERLFTEMKEIKASTLILHGIHDKVCLFPLAMEQNRLIKHSKLVKFENSGHGLFYDEVEKFNSEVKKFIEK